jgi:hypothetical protein
VELVAGTPQNATCDRRLKRGSLVSMSLARFVVLLLTLAVATITLVPAQATALASQEEYLETVRLFHAALESGDGRGALVRLAENAVIFEAGGAELSRQEYAEHHLHGDTRFASATERTIIDQRHARSGDAAWVMTRAETHGSFGDREIHSRGTETMILRHDGREWRIVHVHWSSRPISAPEGP